MRCQAGSKADAPASHFAMPGPRLILLCPDSALTHVPGPLPLRVPVVSPICLVASLIQPECRQCQKACVLHRFRPHRRRRRDLFLEVDVGWQGVGGSSGACLSTAAGLQPIVDVLNPKSPATSSIKQRQATHANMPQARKKVRGERPTAARCHWRTHVGWTRAPVQGAARGGGPGFSGRHVNGAHLNSVTARGACVNLTGCSTPPGPCGEHRGTNLDKSASNRATPGQRGCVVADNVGFVQGLPWSRSLVPRSRRIMEAMQSRSSKAPSACGTHK
ncbi:hypothetical protein VFPBJ_05966 [Purpureocillium lilacinum]|uniref:Uncharacterized protein n=1 Tax=Purpureocillium lilacinum TaxID=33203 RepID=A0A179GSW6_PURLI|nr:hypothetical protein VFPBJ_05966 [Purpureocillium lilacinum]